MPMASHAPSSPPLSPLTSPVVSPRERRVARNARADEIPRPSSPPAHSPIAACLETETETEIEIEHKHENDVEGEGETAVFAFDEEQYAPMDANASKCAVADSTAAADSDGGIDDRIASNVGALAGMRVSSPTFSTLPAPERRPAPPAPVRAIAIMNMVRALFDFANDLDQVDLAFLSFLNNWLIDRRRAASEQALAVATATATAFNGSASNAALSPRALAWHADGACRCVVCARDRVIMSRHRSASLPVAKASPSASTPAGARPLSPPPTLPVAVSIPPMVPSLANATLRPTSPTLRTGTASNKPPRPPPRGRVPLRIAFTGRRRAGKSEAAGHLARRYGGREMAFAEPLYRALHEAQRMMGLERVQDAVFLDMCAEYASFREPGVWVRMLFRDLEAHWSEDVFVSDLRSVREYTALAGAGFYVVRIKRSIETFRDDEERESEELDRMHERAYEQAKALAAAQAKAQAQVALRLPENSPPRRATCAAGTLVSPSADAAKAVVTSPRGQGHGHGRGYGAGRSGVTHHDINAILAGSRSIDSDQTIVSVYNMGALRDLHNVAEAVAEQAIQRSLIG